MTLFLICISQLASVVVTACGIVYLQRTVSAR